MQRAAVTDAARSVGQRSVLHSPLHGKAVLWGVFLSIQASGFLQLPHPFGKVLSVSFFMRTSAFCCAVQSSLLCGSVHSLEKTNGVADVGCRSGNDVGMGLWSLGLRAGASRLAGSGKSTGALKKEAQQAGLTQPLRLLVRRDRDSNPGYSHPYAAFRVRSIRPLWHLSSSGSAALPVPCARGWWWRPWSNPFRSAKLLQPFHSNKHWSEKASPGQGVFIFGADGLCSLSRCFLLFRQES